MPTFVKGDPVANATSYELLERVGDTYNSLALGADINFEVSNLGLSTGDHILVVKAKANEYKDSDYSNEVVFAAVKTATGTLTPVEQTRGYVKFTDGTIQSGNQYINKYEVIPNTVAYYTGAILGSAGVAMASYYDENDNWLGNNGVKSTSTRVDHTDYEFVIPEGVAYMLCTSFVDNIVVKGDYYV